MQEQHPGEVSAEYLAAILAVTEDAMVIEAVRVQQARIDDDSASE